jgi:hypothetical protein
MRSSALKADLTYPFLPKNHHNNNNQNHHMKEGLKSNLLRVSSHSSLSSVPSSRVVVG